ncbi:MAG: DUF420 domain-containing protein [Armatimonadetes bacterium]|nr:MAG: DUF420 domain-containing protein [Armatimonadota bacterium]
MEWVERLPTFNALCNASSAALLITGYLFIRQGRIAQHRLCMLSALAASLLFLAGYLTYHAYHGTTRFPDLGLVRTVYLTILTTHTILAIAIVPMVVMTLHRAFTARFDRHKAIARWTLPLWLYVSVTGVLIYFFLYVWYPTGATS